MDDDLCPCDLIVTLLPSGEWVAVDLSREDALVPLPDEVKWETVRSEN